MLPAALLAAAHLSWMGELAARQEPGANASAERMRIVDAEGDALEGARVMVLRAGRNDVSPMAAVLVETVTDERGVVQSPVPRLPGLLVVVDHPRRLPYLVSDASTPPPRVIRLEEGRTVSGSVVALDTGSDIPNASVCAAWTDQQAPERFRRWERCATSDDAGGFKVAGLSPEPVELRVSAPAHRSATRTVDADSGPLRLELARADEAASPAGGRIRVEVAGADGQPVPEFTMRVEAVAAGRRSGTAVPVNQASVPAVATIPADFLGGGMVAVTFEADNHLRSPMTGLQVAPGSEVNVGTVFLESGAVVSGRLFDAVGAAPAAGCVVELLVTGAGEIRAALMGDRPVAVSDEDGAYLLGGLSGGRYRLRMQCPGAPTLDRLVVLGDSERIDLGETWLDAGQPVAVTVDGLGEGMVRAYDRFREVGAPIAEAALAPRRRTGESPEEDAPRSVAELLLAAGDYRFEASDSAGVARVAREASVAGDGPADRPEVRLRAPARTIRGTLVMDGSPVLGGTVRFGQVLDAGRSSGTIMLRSQAGSAAGTSRMFRAGGQSLGAQVAADGSFEIEGAPEDLLWMTWHGTDGSSVGRLWPEGALPLLDLAGTRVAGMLLDRDGRPMTGNVALIGEVGREVAASAAGEDGTFELPPAPPGRYLLRGRAAAGGSVSVEIDLTVGLPPPQVLRFPQGDPGRLKLSLQRSGGGPAAGAWLHLVDAAGDVAGTGLSSSQGRYSRNRLAPGDFNLVWNDSTACVGGRSFVVEENETTTLDLYAPTGRLLELDCPDEDCGDAPLSFLSVRTESGVELAGHLSGASGGVRFSERGRLALGCITPGAYSVSFWSAGRRWAADAEISSAGDPTRPVVVRGRPAHL